jgi:prepilin-type N-terminal cleavage/methylation domain-containing protein
MKKGFTLVELSIVLVIIGLLLGGILVAQSMIGTAKLQAFTRQVGQFDAAVENFITKFGQFPGDSKLILYQGDETSLGDNNGHLDLASEQAKFWYDLQISGLQNPAGTTFIPEYDRYMSGFSDYPASKPNAVAGRDSFFTAHGGAGATTTTYYFVGSSNRSYTPADALAIDVKIDDGNPVAGYTMGTGSIYFGQILSPGPIPYDTDCVVSGKYTVSDSGIICNLRIRVGSTTGYPR